MSKVSSSSIVVQFTQQFPTWEVFNRWREDWLGGVLAKGGVYLECKSICDLLGAGRDPETVLKRYVLQAYFAHYKRPKLLN